MGCINQHTSRLGAPLSDGPLPPGSTAFDDVAARVKLTGQAPRPTRNAKKTWDFCRKMLIYDTYWILVFWGSPSQWDLTKTWWINQLDDGWPESEKDVFQAALRMVVVKDSRWIVGEFYMSYGKIWCEKVRLIKNRIFGKGHQMTCVL